MTTEIKQTLDLHAVWLASEPGGRRAWLVGAELFGADLEGVDLREAQLGLAQLQHANLSRARLAGADLTRADLGSAVLDWADLESAVLTGAHISGAGLFGANLKGAHLGGADLTGANLRCARLRSADLRGAILDGADLSGADLRSADLSGAYLGEANLAGANLSGATGLLDPADFLEKHFEWTAEGLVVYKVFGLHRDPPPEWRIEPGAILSEVCNPDRGTTSGSGINVGPRRWIEEYSPLRPIWRCLIRWIDLAGVVVPFRTEGQIRCARLTLLEPLGLEETSPRED